LSGLLPLKCWAKTTTISKAQRRKVISFISAA
jgi:hypothetical protein